MADRPDKSARLVAMAFLGASLAIQPRAFSTFIGAASIFVVTGILFFITKSIFQRPTRPVSEIARHTGDVMVFTFVAAGYLGVLLAPWWMSDVLSKRSIDNQAGAPVRVTCSHLCA